MTPAIRRRDRIARRLNQPSCVTNGLPWFSRSSSNLSDGNIVAQPAGRLCLLANDTAEFSSRKIPPICPLTSRAIQNPSMLRPIKNAGIASLTTPGSRGRNSAFSAGGFPIGEDPARTASGSISAVERAGARRPGLGFIDCMVIAAMAASLRLELARCADEAIGKRDGPAFRLIGEL